MEIITREMNTTVERKGEGIMKTEETLGEGCGALDGRGECLESGTNGRRLRDV